MKNFYLIFRKHMKDSPISKRGSKGRKEGKDGGR